MSAGVEFRDWDASTFDPSNLRFFSLLPPEDADEGYCIRHEREMQQIDPVVHYDGALYTTADGWHVYSCAHCRREVQPRAQEMYEQALAMAFFQWDDPDADVLEGAFEYVAEGSPADLPEHRVPSARRGDE